MFCNLFRYQGGMHSTHNYRDSQTSINGTDFVGPSGCIGFHGNANQVRGFVIINTLKTVINQAYLHTLRNHPGQYSQHKRFHPSFINIGAFLSSAYFRFNQCQMQGFLLLPGIPHFVQSYKAADPVPD